jgi:proteic killer suppression protein
MLNAAHRIQDLRVPPGNRLHKLQRVLEDYYGIRVNNQWRIIFTWEGNDAHNVSLTDYH